MKTKLITENIWGQVTSEIRKTKDPCLVAVAYFGAAAAKMLPLPPGSRLVVDASKRAIMAGLTSPLDLAALMKNGVRIYSKANLHAKVFATKRVAFVGSTNVSHNSATNLVEASVRTNEPSVVRSACRFVLQNCDHELGPEMLKRLQKIYRSPKHVRGPRSDTSETESGDLPRMFLANVKRADWSDEEQKVYDAGLLEARRRRNHKSGFNIDSFWWPNSTSLSLGDVVYVVLEEENGDGYVSPPSNFLHKERCSSRRGSAEFIFVERPIRKDRRKRKLAAKIGRGALTKFSTDGFIKDVSFKKALLTNWVQKGGKL